jgi:hypothetical protein
MRRRPKAPPKSSRYSDRCPDEAPQRSSLGSIINSTTLAIMGAVLMLGVGLGIAFSTTINLSPETVATRVAIEESVPNAQVCAQYGAGAIALDLRAFVTLNPFNVYISQPAMQPGCILRSTNWAILERRDLVSSDDIRDCRQRLNTFGFTGDIEGQGAQPRVDCVYQNDSAKNLFLRPGTSSPQESNRF